VDLLLIEGFKTYPHDKIEIHRAATGKPLLTTDDPSIVAVASDTPEKLSVSVPTLDIDDIPGIADFIVAACDLTGSRSYGTA
ncbi:MAG: molybdopterin-guanine dinucleotide biosynthesis protein MobB, partial [Pseudomonadota bacterium]